jgi:penicillin-binding protein 1A
MASKSTRKSSKKTSKSAKPTKKRGFFARAFRFCVKWGFVLGIWVVIGVVGIMLYYGSELPTITKSMVFERRPTVVIKSREGDIVDRYGDIKGEIIDTKDLPPHVINAVLATEDRRFYKHFGMDIRGFVRAVTVNVKQGGFVQGGSTITQQLAKNLFLTRERTIKRKIQELILSFQLERELTKDEILSAYLNRVYLGSGAYGIDAAARVYYNKSAKELNVKEAATIAGLLKAPSRYSPNTNPQLAADRTATVLQAMVDAGYIEAANLKRSKGVPPVPRRKPSSGDSIRYFTDYVVAQLPDLIGEIEQDIIVETTLDKDIQKEMEQSITRALMRYGSEYNVSQGAAVTMRLDGSVVALMGGRDYGISEFNRVTESLRPPGSSFKPIVYLTALENGWNINSLVYDEPITTGKYQPKNFGNKYMGDVTLYTALTNSLNTVAVNLMRDAGPDKTIDTARRLGITTDLYPYLSTALGSEGVPMIQMASAYAVLGRGGIAVQPYAIERILAKDGEILYERTPPKKQERVVEQNANAQLNAMMRSVIDNGTGRGAKIGWPAAGKTGTSQEYRDAWFIGFTDRYATAVWFGNDDNSPTKKLTGGSAPARVWKEVMTKAQTQGGRSYATFIPYSAPSNSDAFDFFLSDVLEDDGFMYDRGPYGVPPLTNQPQLRGQAQVQNQQPPATRSAPKAQEPNENSGGGWFGNIFGGNNNDRNARPTPQAPQGQQQPTINNASPQKEYTPLGRHQWDMNE